MNENLEYNDKTPTSYAKQVVPALIIINGVERKKILPLIKNANFVGRDESAEIIIDDPAVSRKHMLIEVDGNSVCCIDLFSNNGTFVNNQRINKKTLEEKDIIVIGDTTLKFFYQSGDNTLYKSEVYQTITFDKLTGLYTRSYMYYQINIQLEKAKQGKPFSLLHIGIDYFKKIDDTHSHQSGKQVLSELGRLFLSYIRSTDFACYYSSKEFVIILTRTSHEKAYPAGEKLRKIIEGYNFQPNRGKLVKLTVSIGISSYNLTIKSAEQLIDASARALSVAREMGRNRGVTI